MEVMKNTKLREAYEKLEDISEDEVTRIRAEIMRKRILDERNRNRVLGEIENRLKEEQRKMKEEQKKVEEEQKKVEEEQKKVEEEQKKVEEEQKKVEEEQKKVEEEQKKVEEDKKKIEEERKEIVKKLLNKNITIEEIVEITTFSKEEILKIKNGK